MKRVVVTGAGGFIGRHSLDKLVAHGYEVHAVDKRLLLNEWPEVIWHQADLHDSGQVANLMAEIKPSHLLHFAWFAVPGQYWTSPENLRWVQASLELTRQFVQNGGQRMVGAGTCAEYDWGVPGGLCVEQVTPLCPATLYGTCKNSLNQILRIFAPQAKLSFGWGRVFFLYGPYESPGRLVPSVILSLLHGEPAQCTHGNQIRDFMHVDDVASAFVALLDSDTEGAVNIASGEGLALKDLIYQIADQINRRDLVSLGALLAAENEPNRLIAETRRLREEVHWQPRYPLAAGLKNTIEWWKQR